MRFVVDAKTETRRCPRSSLSSWTRSSRNSSTAKSQWRRARTCSRMVSNGDHCELKCHRDGIFCTKPNSNRFTKIKFWGILISLSFRVDFFNFCRKIKHSDRYTRCTSLQNMTNLECHTLTLCRTVARLNDNFLRSQYIYLADYNSEPPSPGPLWRTRLAETLALWGLASIWNRRKIIQGKGMTEIYSEWSRSFIFWNKTGLNLDKDVVT